MGTGALPVAALAVLPRLQSTHAVATVVACGIPYLPLPVFGMSAAMVVASRSRGAKVLWSGVLVAALAACAYRVLGAPGSPGPTREDADLTVVSANVLYGRADTRELHALAQTADVLAVQENTPSFDASLRALLAADFPFEIGTSSDDAQSTKLWSRTPLEVVATGDTDFSSMVATTEVRGVRWTIANVHPVPPQQNGSSRWASDAGKVLELLESHLAEHLVVVGDFNAIEEHLTMRRFAAMGLRNAMSGWRSPGVRAWQPSWPSDKPFVPPLIRIDHALHSASVDAWRPQYVVVTGSDHKALVGTFRAQ
jgi:endonuclease/exonuclease/phosphatase (EEP) superfamily protein YafD